MSITGKNGFPLVPISAFCETGSGGTPSRSKASTYFGGPIPWVKSGELRENTIVETEETLTDLGLKESAAKLLPRDTLLVALYGATVGRIGVLGVAAATNQAVCYIIPDERQANRKYLFYALQSQVPLWLSKRVGGGQPNISQGIIRDTLIPLPSLPIQKRIADILEKAEAIRRKRQGMANFQRDFTTSVFYEMFGEPRTNSLGLSTQPLGQLVRFKSGDFLPQKNMNTLGPYAVYGGNGINGRHDAYLFEEPRIVIGRVGVYCGVVHVTEPKCWITDNALYVAEKSSELTDEYLAEALRLANLNQYANQSGQPLISGSRIENVEILVPHKSRQDAFAKVLDKGRQLANIQASALQQSEDLFNSIVQRAFRGELWNG